MFFRNPYVFLFWTKVASALEGLSIKGLIKVFLNIFQTWETWLLHAERFKVSAFVMSFLC